MSTCNDCANNSYCKLPSRGVCNPAEDCKMFTPAPKPCICKPAPEYKPMTDYEIDAMERIMGQIELGYIDINGFDDTDEIRLIENALYEYEQNHKGENKNA